MPAIPGETSAEGEYSSQCDVTWSTITPRVYTSRPKLDPANLRVNLEVHCKM